MTDKNSVPEEADKLKGSGPHDPDEINPKLASDTQYWAQEFNVTGQQCMRQFAFTELTSRRYGKPPSDEVIHLGGRKARTAAIQQTI